MLAFLKILVNIFETTTDLLIFQSLFTKQLKFVFGLFVSSFGAIEDIGAMEENFYRGLEVL